MGKYKLLLLGLIILLTGCEEERAEERSKSLSKKPLPVQELAEDLYHLPPEPEIEAPLPPKPLEQTMITPVEFPSPQPLFREEQARRLRGKREALAYRAKERMTLQNPRFRLTDPDYRQWEPFLGEDKSTYPVDRDRILTADMRIGAVLEDSINSQVPGRVIAIVDRDVLSPNGKFILVPAYTKIICGYEGLDQTGETRLPVTCTRAIRPDGASILLTKAISADQMGRTGLIGEVDNRTFERYSGAFIISAMSALAQAGVNPKQTPGVQNAATTLSNNLGQVTAEVIKQNIDLRPIITIAAGSRIQIIPQTDIVLRKPIEERQ